MKKCLLALIVVVLLSARSQGTDGVPTTSVSPKCGAIWDELGKVAGRLKGRVLGSLVQKGMTTEQVEQVLGRGSYPFPAVGLVGGVIFGSMPYRDLGLWVGYGDDKDGVLRVDKVTFSPLFDGPQNPPDSSWLPRTLMPGGEASDGVR